MKKKRPAPPPVVHIKKRNGRLNIEGINLWHSYWREPYHLLLTIPLPGFLGLVSLGYVAINAIFALAYLLQRNAIANARPGNFFDVFFFSIQTMSSIGYGFMYPHTFYANVLVSIEALLGVLGVAMATGLMFARFSRPTARVLFSRVAVIIPQNGIPTLMFRAANQRRNQIVEAQLRVRLARDEISTEGDFMRRFYDLKLVRSQNPLFSLSWTAMHQIDEHSPLYGATPESLAESETELLVSLNGLDETVSQTVHARHTFAATEILWNMRFIDILRWTASGERYIDYSNFHNVTRL